MSDVSRSDFDEIAQDFLRVREALSENNGIIRIARVDDVFCRYLLVSVVSRLEQKRECVAKKAFDFLKRESYLAGQRNLARDSRFVTTFFRDLQKSEIKNSPFFSFLGEKINGLDAGLSAIIYLFVNRNEFIHNDFAFKSIDVSAAEVVEKFKQAVDFLDKMTSYCEEYEQLRQ